MSNAPSGREGSAYSGEGVKGAGRKREKKGEVEGGEGEGREEGIDGLQVCDAKKVMDGPAYCWRNLQQMRQSQLLHASSHQETYRERQQLCITMDGTPLKGTQGKLRLIRTLAQLL